MAYLDKVGLELLWTHIISKLGNKANKSDLTSHIDNTLNPHRVTADQIGADAIGSASTALANAKSYTDAEIAALVNSAPETLNTLGELATAFKENQDVVAALDAAITTKQNIKKVVATIESPLMLSDNTEYRLVGASSLTFVYPDGNFEIWMNISFAQTGTIVVTFPAETRYLGAAPTFNNGETWEISIKDGVAVCWRVE